MIRVHGARYLSRFPRLRTPAYVIVGQDGGQSIVWDKGVVFLFSDTLLVCAREEVAQSHPEAPVQVPPGMQTVFLANCAALTTPDGNDLQKTLLSLRHYLDADGLPKEILPPSDRERFRRLRFWPEHGVFIDGKIYFYYLGIQTTDASSVWGFRTIGVGIASLDPSSGECTRFQHGGDWLYWRTTKEDLHFGVQVLQHDGYVYAFGSMRNGVQNCAFLGRVRPSDLTDRAAYEYLGSCGTEWTSKCERAGNLGPCAADYSVSYNPHLGCYTMIYVEEYRKRLMIRTAESLCGPFSEPVDLIGVPHEESSSLVYLGFEHAYFQQGNGRKIFVSYCEPHFAATSLVSLALDSTTG
jgi:Domain of unknown function (DUF4185)